MSAGASLRRVVVFTLVFGGIMGVVAWQSGGLEVPDAGQRTDEGDGGEPRPPARNGDVVPIDAGASMGSGRGIRVSRDAVAVVNGVTVTYRAYEAAWERQTPLPSSSVDERRLHTELFDLLLFHRKPTAEEPRPPAIEGPDTTRVTASEAELDMRPGSELRAQLAGDVVIVRHDEAGDLTLRTTELDLERVERSQGAEELHASSAARVVVDGRGTNLEGTGLEADLGQRGTTTAGDPARVTLLRDVRGTLLARRGAFMGQGGLESEEAVPATIQCAGSAELIELEAGGKRQPSRWLATFQDDVVVTQSPTEMRCETLEIEFRMAKPGSAGDASVEILRAIADGDVLVSGSDEATADTWSLRTHRATTTRDAKGGYEVLNERGTVLAFSGTLRGLEKDAAERGRVEVRCDGPSTIVTDPAPLRQDVPIRSRITFRENVIARQWDEAGELETEIRAAEVMLLGSRTNDGDQRLDPDTLTATGDEEERVFVQRAGMTARTRALTWRVLREKDTERLLLSGRPALRMEGSEGFNLVGAARSGTPATLLLNAKERIEITWRHTPPEELRLPAGEPYVTAQAREDVVVQRLVEERETYRLESQALDATLDKDMQPTHFRAYGRVVVTGRGEQEGDRHVEMRGDRLAADRTGGDGSEWIRTDVLVFGQEGSLATATIHEPPPEDGSEPFVHVVRAEQLRYEKGGTLVTAKRHASIHLDRAAKAASGDERLDVSIIGRELRAHLNPPEDPKQGAPEVLRVEGEGGVTLETPGYRVTGSTLAYDRVAGIAVATGRPARGILRHPELEDVEAELESYVASEKIRVEFDPTDAAESRPRRVTCEGGALRYHMRAGEKDGAPHLERITLRAEGPIEVLGETATAEKDVEILWESRSAGSRMRQDARLLCERAELNFDTQAGGPARDNVRRAVATGSRRRAAQLFTPQIDATADRVESSGPWIDLMSPWGRRVSVRRKSPPESFTCEKGRYNFVTQEFEATRARAEER